MRSLAGTVQLEGVKHHSCHVKQLYCLLIYEGVWDGPCGIALQAMLQTAAVGAAEALLGRLHTGFSLHRGELRLTCIAYGSKTLARHAYNVQLQLVSS